MAIKNRRAYDHGPVIGGKWICRNEIKKQNKKNLLFLLFEHANTILFFITANFSRVSRKEIKVEMNGTNEHIIQTPGKILQKLKVPEI